METRPASPSSDQERAARPLPAAAFPPSVNSLPLSDLLMPRGIAGVFDLAFDIYRKHFRALATIAAVILLPLQAALYFLFNLWLKPLNTYTDAHSDDAGAALGLIAGGILTGYPQLGIPGLLSLLALAIASAPIAFALADIYRGITPLWSDCCRRAFFSIPRVLLGWAVAGLAFAAICTLSGVIGTIALSLIAFALKTALPQIVYSILFVVAVIASLLLGMTVIAFNFSFTSPLIALEQVGITQLPSRCWQLIGKRRALRTWTAIVFLPVVFFTVQALMLFSISSLLSLFTLPPILSFCVETVSVALLIVFLQPYLLVFLDHAVFRCAHFSGTVWTFIFWRRVSSEILLPLSRRRNKRRPTRHECASFSSTPSFSQARFGALRLQCDSRRGDAVCVLCPRRALLSRSERACFHCQPCKPCLRPAFRASLESRLAAHTQQ